MKFYHYTRAYVSSIERNGLHLLDVKRSRARFLFEQRHKLTTEDREEFIRSWENNAPIDPDDLNRESVWLVTKKIQSTSFSIKYLIMMYGGEAVTMGIDEDGRLGDFLRGVGEPLEVVLEIPKDDPLLIHYSTDVSIGRTILPHEIVKINILRDIS
jgi:hypothetical protein